VARDFTDLVRVTIRGGPDQSSPEQSGTGTTRVVGTVLGQQHRPHLLEAWGSRFNVQLEPHLAVFRYRDQPGMLGRIGTAFGDAGINIVSAAVGHRGDDESVEAVVIVTSDAPVPPAVLASTMATADFFDARAISL
jgi:D-3-phosphoglycerate dehydrogenase